MLSIVAFKTFDILQGSVEKHLRCGGIFSDSIIENFLPILTVNNFENRLIFGKVKAYKSGVPILVHPVEQQQLQGHITSQYTLTSGLTEIAGLDIDGRVKKRGWTLQDWTMTDEFAEVDIAGLDIDGRLRRGGHCRTGH